MHVTGGRMKRIGVLGVDALSEKLIAGFFQAETGAQVFLSPANSERAQRLARKFPCWTLDNHQAVIDEADVIIISVNPDTLNELARGVRLRDSHTLIFQPANCVRLRLAYSDGINQSAVILTAADEEIQRLFASLGPLLVAADESDFDSTTGGPV